MEAWLSHNNMHDAKKVIFAHLKLVRVANMHTSEREKNPNPIETWAELIRALKATFYSTYAHY